VGSNSVAAAFTPGQIRRAYGFDQITFDQAGSPVLGDGSGQTIAIVAAYHNPNLVGDLKVFDRTFGLPDPPNFLQINEVGGDTPPDVDPTSTWATEEALDVEWAHAVAPGAAIVLVESNSDSFSDLNTAVDTARHWPGVSVVSMSYGGAEFSGETSYDGYFTTAAGHGGVTFVAAAGDGEASLYPAVSPNVLAVGGTHLTITAAGDYVSESTWNGGGSGASQYEVQRNTPDVAFDADPLTGVAVYDSYNHPLSPWIQAGGTSVGAPAWAGLIAIVNQGRAIDGLDSLDGAALLSQLPGSDFHNVLSDPVAGGAGRGSPNANSLVPHLVHGSAVLSDTGAPDGGANSKAGAGKPAVKTAFRSAPLFRPPSVAEVTPGLLTTSTPQTVVPSSVAENLRLQGASAVSGVVSAQTMTIAASAAPKGDDQHDQDPRIERTLDDADSQPSGLFFKDEIARGLASPTFAWQLAGDTSFGDASWLIDSSKRDTAPIAVQNEVVAPHGVLPLDLAAIAFVLIGASAISEESDNGVRRRFLR
jgi:hypothetical protein